LLDSEAENWPIFALIYVALKVRKRAPNTQRQTVTALKFFYDYIVKKHNCNFETYLINEGLEIEILVNELDGFSCWLEAGCGGLNIIALDGSELNSAANRIYITKVLMFLDFLNRRYTCKKYQKFKTVKETNAAISRIDKLIKAKRKDLTISGSNMKNNYFKSLTVYQLDAVKAVTYPHTVKRRNPLNPFKGMKVSYRNYLIVMLLYEYGIRRGELHLLTTRSFNLNIRANYCYLVITNTEDEITHKNDSSIKTSTSHRTLKLSKIHYEELRVYVEKVREKTKSVRLFPISSRMINLIFEQITKVVHKNYPEIADVNSDEYIESIHPHSLRHTWADGQLEYLVEVREKTLPEAKDMIRGPGGWSLKSLMPDMYAARYLTMKSNQANVKRIEGSKR